MPITPPAPIPGQVGPSGNQPYVAQSNFGQIVGECLSWNPNAQVTMIQRWVNSTVRRIYDRRLWYGLMVRGQISSPTLYSTGTVALTTGSATVTGTGTVWTPSMVGLQIRVGYNNPIYTIVAVNSATSLTLELPWASPSFSSVGYYIAQYYYSLPNIKFIHLMLNLQLMQRMWTNYTQQFLDTIDPARIRTLYPSICAAMPPDSNGNYQIELWPASLNAQAFPYIAYIQPPNLVNDTDVLPAYIRTDVIVSGVIPNVLRYRPKDNPYYDAATALAVAETKEREHMAEIESMAQADEALYRQDIIHQYEQWPMVTLGGSFLDAMSPVMSAEARNYDFA